MDDKKLYFKEFEFEFEKKSLLKEVNKFISNIKNFKLISINENIFYTPKKKLMSRINIYYTIDDKEPIKRYDLIKLTNKSEKRDLKNTILKLDESLNKNKKVELIGITNNHHIENAVLMLKISLFLNKL